MSKDKGPVLKKERPIPAVYRPIIDGLKIPFVHTQPVHAPRSDVKFRIPFVFVSLIRLLHFVEFMRQWRIRYKLDPIFMKSESQKEVN